MNLLKTLFELQEAAGIKDKKCMTFEMSVWNIDGKAVSFLVSYDDGVKCFDRRELDFPETGGKLPENFFDYEVKRLELTYRSEGIMGEVTAKDGNEEWTDEVVDLFGLREINHNLIFCTDMKSVRESDYYNYRENFPAGWEDTFKLKDYYFYIGEDVGLRGKNEDGSEFAYENGYWQISSISGMDAMKFYEEKVCGNYCWDIGSSWEIGMKHLDCSKMFRGATETEKLRDPDIEAQMADYFAKYIAGKKCFGKITETV